MWKIRKGNLVGRGKRQACEARSLLMPEMLLKCTRNAQMHKMQRLYTGHIMPWQADEDVSVQVNLHRPWKMKKNSPDLMWSSFFFWIRGELKCSPLQKNIGLNYNHYAILGNLPTFTSYRLILNIETMHGKPTELEKRLCLWIWQLSQVAYLLKLP